ncbi:unnamed protein product, partial [Ceratitis capitata]
MEQNATSTYMKTYPGFGLQGEWSATRRAGALRHADGVDKNPSATHTAVAAR